MNLEEKIEEIYKETKRIRILFGVSIIILATILAFIAPVIIRSQSTFGGSQLPWSNEGDSVMDTHALFDSHENKNSLGSTSAQTASTSVNTKVGSTTPPQAQ